MPKLKLYPALPVVAYNKKRRVCVYCDAAAVLPEEQRRQNADCIATEVKRLGYRVATNYRQVDYEIDTSKGKGWVFVVAGFDCPNSLADKVADEVQRALAEAESHVMAFAFVELPEGR